MKIKNSLACIMSALLILTVLSLPAFLLHAEPKATVYDSWSETSPFFGWVYGYDSDGNVKSSSVTAAVYINGPDDTYLFTLTDNVLLKGTQYYKAESACNHELYDVELVMYDDSCGICAFKPKSIGNGEMDILRAESAYDAEYIFGCYYNAASGQISVNDTMFTGDLKQDSNGNYTLEYLYSSDNETGIKGPTIILNQDGRAVAMIGSGGMALAFASDPNTYFALDRQDIGETKWTFTEGVVPIPEDDTTEKTTEATTETTTESTTEATEATTEETTQSTTEKVTETTGQTTEATTEAQKESSNSISVGLLIVIIIICLLLGAAVAVIVVLVIVMKKKK